MSEHLYLAAETSFLTSPPADQSGENRAAAAAASVCRRRIRCEPVSPEGSLNTLSRSVFTPPPPLLRRPAHADDWSSSFSFSPAFTTIRRRYLLLLLPRPVHVVFVLNECLLFSLLLLACRRRALLLTPLSDPAHPLLQCRGGEESRLSKPLQKAEER